MLTPFLVQAQIVKVVRFKTKLENFKTFAGTVYFDPSCITFTKAIDNLKDGEIYLYLWIDKEAYTLSCDALEILKKYSNVNITFPVDFFEISNKCMLNDDISFSFSSIEKTQYFTKLLNNSKTYIASDDCDLAIPLLKRALIIIPSHPETLELLKKCGQ